MLLLVLIVIVIGYLTAAGALQRAVLFPRPPAPAVSPAEGRDDVEILRVGAAGDVEAWYLAARNAAGLAPAVIFTHGNGELIDYWLDEFAHVPDWGVAVLLLEYPGYGRSGGSPSEETITAAILSAYDRLVARPEVDPARIVAYGRSIGAGASCALARERRVAALILESSFTSVRDLARRFGLVGRLVLDPFENLPVVERFDGPILLVHGEHDEIIPVAHAYRLAEAARNAELHVLPCGHNDCPRPWKLVRDFLERHSLV